MLCENESSTMLNGIIMCMLGIKIFSLLLTSKFYLITYQEKGEKIEIPLNFVLVLLPEEFKPARLLCVCKLRRLI